MTNQLVFPMTFYVFFIFGSGVYMFLTRLAAVKSGQISIKYFRALMGEMPPEKVVVAARHYDNQFQVPLLFLVTCVVANQFDFVNSFTLTCAWAFVASRLLHSYILLGSNRVQYRVMAFMGGWFFVILIWAQMLFKCLTF